MIFNVPKKKRFRSGIYSITNLKNGKRLIGSTNNFRRRFYNHSNSLENNKHPNTHLQSAYNKYGATNFVFEIIACCSSANLLRLEHHYCLAHRTYNFSPYNTKLTSRGYNQKEARRHPILSQEVRTKMGKSRLGRKFSEISKLKISLAKRGQNNYNFGLHLSKEIKRKISNALMGRKLSTKTKDKISMSHKNKPKSELHRRHLSESLQGKHVGKLNPFFGKHHSPKTIARLREISLRKNNAPMKT